MTTKLCSKCNKLLPVSEFYKIGGSSTSLRSRCKQCIYDETMLWQSSNKDKVIKSRRKSYAKNKDVGDNREKHCARTREYSQTANGKYTEYKSSAKKRKIEFNLTFDDFSSFWQIDCHYCGREIQTIGIDRINSLVGYEISNILPCCPTCNGMKMDLSYIEFINHIKLLQSKLASGR